MATEDEAREAADGQEVQVENGHLGTTHLQMNLDSKLSPHGQMKDEVTASAMDLTEGMKVSEDQVLERAPSAVQIPQEDTPNGTHSSLNGHMKEGKILNVKPQENGQKGNEQVETSPDGISTEQSSASNGKEAIDCLGHVESTAEDTSLLKHDNEEPKEHCQQDVEGDAMEDKMVHEDRLQPDNDVEPTIDAQQGHDLEPAEVTEDTQPATMPSIPGEEVVAEAPAGAQTSPEANVDEPDALPDTSDGNTKTVEPAKVDKENCPEDEDIEVVKLEDQPSAKTDDVDADMVQEEVPKSKKTDVPEDMPKTEKADESTNGDQEVLNQESPKETSDPLHEKTEETSHESNVSTSEETTPEHDAMTREPALDVEEVQKQGLAEEIADAKEVDTEKTVQQSGIAFEEATPEDNATITEPSSEIQHLNNVEPEEIKSLEDAKAEETSDQSNVTTAEDGTQDKEATKDIQPVQGLEEEEPKNTGTVEMDEASNQPHADVINNLAEEDDVLACQPQVIELKEEVKDTGATETQEITQQSHAAASEELVTEDSSMATEPLNDDIQQTLEQESAEVKHAEVSETQEICLERTISAPEEDSVEDDVTAEGPTCDAKEVENVASVEEIKDNTAQNIIETSSVATVEEADQEHNVLPSEDVSEQEMRGLETEEIQNTEPVETEEASDQRHPALLNEPAQEDSIPSDVPKTGSTVDVKETEALPQESNVSISDEPASEENITASEVTCDDQEVNLEQAEAVESNKDTRTKEISDQSNEVFAREAAQGTSDLAREPAADMQSVQELQSEKKNAELTEVSEASGQMDAAVIENPTHEDNLTTSESLVMESAEVSSNEATEGQGMTQSDATQSEDHKTEENMPVSEPQILEPEPAEEMRDSEATEPRAISQESMCVPEEYVTAKEAASDIKEVHTEELIEKPDDVKAQEISNQSSGAIVGETAQEHKLLSSDPTSDVQAKELESEKNGNSEDVQTEEASHQTYAEENLTENEPQIATEDNTAILTDVSIQQLQEQEPVEFRDTEATEPQGISPSHTAFGSEQSTLEDNEMTEPSPATQAENLESAIVTEESKDVKITDAIAEEETPKEHVQESEAHVDIPPVENTEPVEVHENVTANDLPAEEVKENEAIEVAEIHYESPVANIGDPTEDAKSNVALEDEAAPDEDAKATEATAAIPQPQEPELEEIKNSEPVEVEDNITARDLSAEEIEDTEAMETEMIPHESTGGNINELINDVKTNIALADEAAPDEHAKATEATVAIPQLQEPDLEEIKNSEPAEVEGNTSASDLPAKNVNDTEAVETEAINYSTDANNSELTEDVQSNVSLTDEAAHDEHVTVAERTVDIPQAQETKLEEVKNTELVEVEETRSASDLLAEEVRETEANNESSDANISNLNEDVENNVALTEEAAPEEHVMATEATVDIPEAQEPELEETKNTEPTEVAENVSANDLPAEEVKDTEAMETETINESTNTDNSELTEDVKNIVALADEAAPEEHVIVADDTVDIPRAQEPEVEEVKNTEPAEVEENISASDVPAEEMNGNEAKETEATKGSTDANFSEITEDVKSNVALADEAAPEEHVIATETTVDIAQAQEPELEEIKNTEPVEMEENISASDMPAEEMKDTEANETEAINESIHANIGELTEDVKSNLACADEAAPEEHVIATAATVDIPRTQEPELEEIKNTEPAEVEAYVSENDLPAEELKDSEAVETEAINESTDANNTELTEDVKSNVVLADEAAPEEHVTVADNTVDIPQAQEPEVEEIQNDRPVKVEENIPASDLPAEKVKDIEAFNESTDANISELTEDVKSNVTPAEEAAPEEHVIAADATVDIPQAQVPELKDLENAEPVEVEENRSAGNLPAEEVKETEAINESIDANISELTEDVTSSVNPADEAAHEEHVTATEGTVDIPRAQGPELEEIKNTEPVEVKENTSASDVPAEEVKDTEAINESTHANISELTEDMKRNFALTDEAAHKEHVTVAETTVDIPHTQEPELEEIKNTEAGDLPEEEVKETEAISERTDANISELSEDVKSNVAPADEEPHAEHVTVAETTFDIPQAQETELEEIKSVEPVEVEENRSASGLQAEVVKETEAINKSPDANISELTEDVTSNVAPADEAAPEEHVIATEAPVDIPRAQELDLEEIKNTEPVGVEENISANDLSAEEVKETEAKKTEAINEITGVNISELTEDVRGNVAHADEAAPEEHVMAAEATDDIPEAQVSELRELENAEPVEMEENKSAPDLPAEEVKDTQKTEVATLEDPSPTDHGTEPEQNPVELDKENLGNKISNAILADENIKEELQEPIEQKDESSDLGERTAFTTQKDESATEEDVVQISGEDTVGTSNNIEQIKQQPKSVTEQDAIKSGDHTNDQDDEQLHNVELQMQVCERSVDVLTTEQPDEHIQKVNLDQQQKEDEAIEKQTEEIQTDEQKHVDSRADFTTETILEPQSNENDTTKGKDGADVFEAEQTETMATEMLKDEQTLHIPQQSIPSITDAKVENSTVENSTEIEETTEQEDAPNNTGTLHTDADAEKCKEDEKENTEMDAAATNISTDKHDGTIDETINEEYRAKKHSTDDWWKLLNSNAKKTMFFTQVENDLGSPIKKDLQKTSDLAPSNEEMQGNDPTAVPQNIESRVHSEEKECINKANDGMQVPQALEEEIVDEVEKKEEIQNEDTDVNHDKIETKPVDEEASGLHSSNSTDTKMDDTMSPSVQMVHERIDAQPTENEEVEENEGFNSISEYAVENPKQNDVEQDLSIHPKVVDDKLATEQNGAEVETDSNEEMATGYTASTESVKLGEAIYDKASRADGALSETIEENGRNLEASPAVTASGESINEDNEHHNFALPAHSAEDRNETEQASGLEVTERELFLEKPLPTESEEQEESQITKEQGEENIQEQETGHTEKEEKEAEQSDLPVSHFLMNLIMGKESNEPDGSSEFEAEKKQEETAKDESSLIPSEQEESLVPIPTENMVEKELISEKGKHNLEGSEETHDIKLEKDEELNRNTQDLEAPVCQNNVQGETSSELVVPGGSGLITEMETRDVKLGQKATNSVCQEHMEATTQIEEGSLKTNLDDITGPKVSQEETLEEGRTDLHHEHLPENRSSDAVSGQTLVSTEPNMGDEKDLPNNTDDLQSPLSTKSEESNKSSIIEAESTVEVELENGVDKEEENQQTTTKDGATEEQIENVHDISQKGAEAISDEEKGEITEPVMGNEINLVQEKEISAVSECKEEKQSYKFSNSDLDNSEKDLEIQLDGSSLHIDQDKQDESAGGQIVTEKNNLLDKPGESNLQKEQETEVAQKSSKESDEGDQNSLAIREPVIKEVNVHETVDSHVLTVNTQSNEEQETFNSQVQKRDLDVASPEEAPEIEEKFVESKPEFSIIEEQSPKKDESNMAGEKTSDEKTKDVQEAKSFTDEAKAKIEEQGAVQKASHNQKHNLDVVSPTEAPGSEDNSVDIKEPEFSTDEEQSPKKDVSNIAEEKSYDKKTNGDEEAKNFTDDAPMKIEEREAGQKTSPKKHNILSGVGSKVKHQLAKVKKAIIGKPGHTKSELPKA